jgi:hypothetical protein
MNMSTRTRVAITIASALALGITHYGSTWTAGDPGLARDLWRWSVPAAYGFAIFGVFLVDRWWALLPAFAPLAAGVYLYNFTDYVYPWESESIAVSGPAGIVLFALGVGIQAAVLSIGFLPRRVWDAGRRLGISRRGRAPSPRG